MPIERLPAGFLDAKSSIWVGPGKHAVVYFLRGGALLNFVGAVELEEEIEESWTQKRPWAELKADFEGWHPDILTIIEAADRDACFRWPLNVHPHLEQWSTARATLVGDAAHPMLPYMAQGAAVAVEDGAILTRALAEAGSVPEALALYESHRKPRAPPRRRRSARQSPPVPSAERSRPARRLRRAQPGPGALRLAVQLQPADRGPVVGASPAADGATGNPFRLALARAIPPTRLLRRFALYPPALNRLLG